MRENISHFILLTVSRNNFFLRENREGTCCLHFKHTQHFRTYVKIEQFVVNLTRIVSNSTRDTSF